MFIKYHNSEQAKNLQSNMAANHLLSVISQRISIHGNPVKGILKGEAPLGDFEEIGMTRQQYRTALENLKKWGLITVRTTSKGTLAKLVNNEVYEVFYFDEQPSSNQQPTNSQPPSNQQPTTTLDNKNIDIENKEEESTPTQDDLTTINKLQELDMIRKGELPMLTELDKHFNFALFGKEWSDNFKNEVITYFRYMESKKGSKWGIIGTLSSQLDVLKSYLNEFSENEIIEALRETQLNGNVSYNPKWTKNRKSPNTPQDQKQEKLFPYELPTFKDLNERFNFFFARYQVYKPHLDNRLCNTVYRDRIYQKKDVEGLVFELELENPNLLKIYDEERKKMEQWQNSR